MARWPELPDWDSPPPISEDRLPAVSLARGRALASEWVPNPEPVGALLLANLPSLSDGLSEGRRGVLSLEDRLTRNPHRFRSLPERAALLQLPQNQSASPVEHGRSLPRKERLVDSSHGRARGLRELAE